MHVLSKEFLQRRSLEGRKAYMPRLNFALFTTKFLESQLFVMSIHALDHCLRCLERLPRL